MDREYWEGQYRQMKSPALPPVVTGFNINLDRIVTVDRNLLEDPALSGDLLAGLNARLRRSMEHCTAAEWIIDDPDEYHTITDHFSSGGSLTLGGQAGIAAQSLAGLGAPEVICITPEPGETAAALIRSSGARVAGMATGPDMVHTIFEYPPGLVPLAEGATPRNNRFIVSPKKGSRNTILKARALSAILPDIAHCTRAFLSGYQYLSTRTDFLTAASQVQAIRRVNRDMRTHIECVSVTDPAVNAGILHHILPVADSTGMNESELTLLLGRPAGPGPAELVRDMLGLAHRTGISRIHLHTFGYYLEVIRTGCTDPGRSRDALMYAACAGASAAGGRGSAVTPAGVTAVNQVIETFGAGDIPGCIPAGEYWIIAIPSLIAGEIVRTVGLGDIISSSAFVAEEFSRPRSA